MKVEYRHSASFYFVLIVVVCFAATRDAFALSSNAVRELESLSRQIAPNLPEGNRVAIQTLSPEKTGLPEEFSNRLVAAIESGLLRNTNYGIDVINRASLESVWADAIEFNNTDFESLAGSSNADLLLVISPSLAQTDVAISIAVYSLKEPNIGRTVVSTGVRMLGVDLSSELGVDLVTMNEQVSGVANQLDLLQKMLEKDDPSKGNQISKIFYEFASNTQLNSLFRVFRECDKPKVFEEVSKEDFAGKRRSSFDVFNLKPHEIVKAFATKCEVWNDDELVVWENIEFETKIDLFAAMVNRQWVGELVLTSRFPNNIGVPDEINPFISRAYCLAYNSPSGGEYTFEVVFPDREPFLLIYSVSGGSGGTWGTVHLLADTGSIENLPSEDYRECALTETEGGGGYWEIIE